MSGLSKVSQLRFCQKTAFGYRTSRKSSSLVVSTWHWNRVRYLDLEYLEYIVCIDSFHPTSRPDHDIICVCVVVVVYLASKSHTPFFSSNVRHRLLQFSSKKGGQRRARDIAHRGFLIKIFLRRVLQQICIKGICTAYPFRCLFPDSIVGSGQ